VAAAARERQRGEKRGGKKAKEIKMVDPQFGGGRGPPEIEAWRGNLEGHAKWRSIWRPCWS
jgi:hypothetical protein